MNPANRPGRLGMLSQLAGPWWMYLLTGIGWFLVSLIVLRFSILSVAAVGTLIGVVFFLGAFSEILSGSVRSTWRWAHVLLAVLFFLSAFWALFNPVGAFWALASVLGLLLVLRGSLDIITSISARELNGVWWLGLVAGVIEILLGFWASQASFPLRAELLLLWVGFFALFRGVNEIVLAFEVHAVQHRTA
jgi:uncharacterized membrane protein HdeD (DUF308 family)